MADYGRPGVYITERLLPPPITVEGAANAAGAVVGAFATGTTDVTLVTSWYDFVKKFGGYSADFPATFGVAAFFQNGGSELYVRRVLGDNSAAASEDIVNSSAAVIGTVTTLSAGTFGNSLRFKFTTGRLVDTVQYYTFTLYQEGANNDSGTVTGDVILEQYTNVRIDDATSPDDLVAVVNTTSKYITVELDDRALTPVTTIVPLTGGDDGDAPVVLDYTNALADFEALNRPLVIFAPEITAEGTNFLGSDGAEVQAALIEWAASNNSFAVVDVPAGTVPSGAVTYANAFEESSYGAVYYPGYYISDPIGRSPQALRLIGPAGGVAGLYIQTDRATGPFKAPAGLRYSLRGAVALERTLSNAELDSLNNDSAPVNAIRNVPGAGVVVMGARTLLQDGTANKYVNMRRSLIYLRKSLETLTQFSLFENNDEKLWERIRTTISVFLTDYRNAGGLRGTTDAEAYFIKVDAENNPAASIANGIVNIEVGVALQYPAEFVVITLSQKTAE